MRGQDLISELSTTLNFVADIHLARHVDVDGVLRDGSFSANEIYADTVEKARSLVRTLEAAAQAAHDDGVTLLMTIQSISATKFWRNRNDKTFTYERLDSLCLSLKVNMDLVQRTLEGLLAVGHEQEDTAQGEYNGSIEWRLSKVSMIHQSDDATYVGEDVVDMEYAMNGHSITISSLALGSQSEIGHADPVQRDDLLYSDTKPTNQTDGVPFAPSPSPGLDDDSKSYLKCLSELTQWERVVLDKSPPRQNAGSGKLAKILGDEYADKVAKDSQPWYLRPNYDPSEILIDPDNAVRGGTLAALVERLTAHDQLGQQELSPHF